MEKPQRLNPRINMLVPLDLALLIEKHCEKLGVIRSNFVKDAVREKIERLEKALRDPKTLEEIQHNLTEVKKAQKECEINIDAMKRDVTDIKKLTALIFDTQRRSS